MEYGVRKNGQFFKVYQTDSLTTIVFGAKNLALLEEMVKGFNIEEYLY